MRKLGYTLLELVIVILLVGILAAAAVPLIITPITSYQSNQARLSLVATSDRIDLFFQQRLANAIPNSVLVNSDLLQWLPAEEVMQYATPHQQPACEPLTNNDIEFTVLGQINGQPPLIVRPINAELLRSDWLAGGNHGAVLRDYSMADDSGCANDPTANQNNLVELTSRHNFNPAANTLHRLYTTSSWQGIACNNSALVFAELNDPIANTANLPTVRHTIAEGLSRCQLTLLPGSPTQAPQLRLSIELVSQGEAQPLELLYELYNAP
ncbi:prepilin-type N-terminal cleavage/methylation domain-containing protein [Salinibius halmophilus]|uniref:prepilin-type N-terminal cleavage/methylation domain-containing protein n=1 Tax=Salinibius halmophilus TaxID=1853216 RepID=UPI001313DDCA|nr:prepilin-type N-terminal cleavage/methylation domain-containing protein [Salinibius halmophilus]